MKRTTSKTKLPQWDLTTLIKSEKEIPVWQEKIKQQVTSFQSYRSQLEKPTPELILKIVKDLEKINYDSSILADYAGLKLALNTQDESAKALDAKINTFLSEQSNQLVFFSLWWKSLDNATAEKLLPSAGDYRFSLTQSRRYKPHVLTEAEEKIIALKDVTGSGALANLYSTITNQFTYDWKEKGKIVSLSREALTGKVRSQQPKEREMAFELLWQKYQQNESVLGEIYQQLIRDALTEDLKLRHYPSIQSPRNLSNQLSDELVDSFLKVCEKNASIFQDYFVWKAKYLKIKNSRYHIYAPLPFKEEKVSFEPAWKTVMTVFNNFSPRIKQLAEKVRTDRRLDVPNYYGKRSGAFCSTVVQDQTPFVLLNWTGKDRDMSTLAHELGHAVHSQLASHHTLSTSQAGLPLAETASTFAEMLLDEYLVNESNSVTHQAHLLSSQIDDAYATVGRQSFFALFEKEAFKLTENHQTVPDLTNAYAANLKKQFGSMTIPENARYEWLGIPHFYYSPFYVYAYSFGNLLTLALYQQYKEQGKSFIPKYEKFLGYGGSKLPQDMLMEMGFDPREESSWQSGFDLIKEKIKQLKKITKKK